MTKYYSRDHPEARKLRERKQAEAKRAAQPPNRQLRTPPELARALAERDRLVAAETIRKLNLPERDQSIADAVAAHIAAERRKRPFG